MKVKVSCRDIDRPETEVIVLLFFKDERPLKGASGLIDWRMNGQISRLIIDGHISGEKGESTLIVPNRRVRGGKILMIGLGDSSRFNGNDLFETAADITRQLLNIAVKDFVMAPPPARFTSFDLSHAVPVIIRGILDCLKSENAGSYDMTVTFSVDRSDLHKVASAVQKTGRETEPRLTLIKDEYPPIEAAVA